MAIIIIRWNVDVDQMLLNIAALAENDPSIRQKLHSSLNRLDGNQYKR